MIVRRKPGSQVQPDAPVTAEKGRTCMKNGKLKAVVVGLGFGGAFVPIWRDHPDVGEVGVCELDPKLRACRRRVRHFPDLPEP